MMTLKDLARPRQGGFQIEGEYDHALQQMKGGNGRALITSADVDDLSSSTFWDGERR